MQRALSLEYEPSSDPLHISAPGAVGCLWGCSWVGGKGGGRLQGLGFRVVAGLCAGGG